VVDKGKGKNGGKGGKGKGGKGGKGKGGKTLQDDDLGKTIYHLDRCKTTAAALADVLSTHGANLGAGPFTQIISDFKRKKDLTRALLVIKAMPTDLTKVIHYNLGISACAQARNWKKALQLLEEMQAKGVEPNVITYNATISACEKARNWAKALQLLEEMQAKGVEPNVITYSATISACGKGGQWEKALQLLEEMQA
jgi:pentatricopeptide repeat domain-containing protein 1